MRLLGYSLVALVVLADLLLLVLLVSALIPRGAQAHWRPEYARAPPLVREFFANAKDCRMGDCCGRADGHEFYGEYRLEKDGGAVVEIDGSSRRVEPCDVLRGPNPTGSAVIWYELLADGKVGSIYCFSPGVMS